MLKTWLGKKGFNVDSTSSNAKARKLLLERNYSLVLSDMRLPDQDGIVLLSWMKDTEIDTPFIIMTSYADIQSAVRVMKEGACDYIAKPMQPDELLKKINEALHHNMSSATSPTKPLAKPQSEHIEGESEIARQLYNYVGLVAPTQMSVLINGASGTGKEYVAHRIHQLSKRFDKPFVAIDCGAIPKELAASEFFGHVKGAFTGAVTDKTGAFVEANGGTLFLDEIGNLNYEIQVQLLRVLQERLVRPVGSTKEISIDVRLVCATNENLPQAIEKGTFREDLYHRINEFSLKMPSLKERDGDIMIFANFFLDQANDELERNIIGFDSSATIAIKNYTWPGNLRQMKNVIKRAALIAQGDHITLSELHEIQINDNTTTASPLNLHNEETEKRNIVEALQQTNKNKSKAATLLGIDRKTLYNKLKLYNIDC